jgi:polar amino acid transport system ATP-binding protein
VSSIAARNITMVFATRGGEVRALDDVSIEVPDGHFACIVGASGCGKSTLLNIMAGLVRPTSGTVEVGDRRVDEPGADRGMVFQSYTLFPWLRVRQNVEFGPSLKGVPSAERRRIADSLLEEMGLSEFARAYPNELSGGMKQRVAIARALALQPRIMLFDEVTSALDPELVEEVLNVMRRLARETDMTMLLVTHEMSFAHDFADRVLFFDGGRIIEEGPPDRIFTKPRQERTQAFLRKILAAGHRL